MSKTFRILSYFREDAWRIVLSILLIWVGRAFSILMFFPMAIFIDSMAGKQGNQWAYRLFYHFVSPQDRGKQVIVLTAATLILTLGSEVARTAQRLVSIRVGLNGMMRVRCDLFRKLQELSLGYHRSQPQGDAIYRVAYDSYGFQGAVNVIVAVVDAAVTLISITALMLSMDWRLTLLAMVVIPMVVAVIRGYSKVLKDRSTEARERESSLYTALQRSMSSIGLVQAFSREEDEFRAFEGTAEGSVRAAAAQFRQEVGYWLVLGIVLGTATTAMFGFGAYLAITGVITAGYLSIFLGYVRQLYDPLYSLSSSGSGWMTAMAGVDRVLEVLDRESSIKDSPNAVDLSRQPRTLEMDHVAFAYREGQNVIQNVTVSVKPGEMVAFVGSSGVGKTTLLNLFPRFYDPSSGCLKLDGQDLRNVKLKSLRAHIALVLQESIILPTSIAENIAYGQPKATDTQIRKAAKMAGADLFIENLQGKYEMQVNEGGSNLSGGQRQRIGIARALLTEAPIIVMDEPTSALDAEHEQFITETLRSIKRMRTIIIVSHRLSTVADCDRIYVMEAGTIIEQGTHDELVAMKGAYYRMAKHQMKVD
jgi:ATP-binding cassette, subfamily B, bacterial